MKNGASIPVPVIYFYYCEQFTEIQISAKNALARTKRIQFAVNMASARANGFSVLWYFVAFLLVCFGSNIWLSLLFSKTLPSKADEKLLGDFLCSLSPPTPNETKYVSDYDPQEISSRYAYAFVIGGCDPDNQRYHGFFYNVLVSANILREEGSKSDVVLFVQMAYASSMETLPNLEQELLEKLNIKVRYIPKVMHESFYDTVLNKFRILTLTQYRRVLLLDADCMPLGNLDYLFEFADGPSETSVLKENVVISGPWEPANAGLFMLKPRLGDFEKIHTIVNWRELRGSHFDEKIGWGHVITPPDKWTSRNTEGTLWNFHFAFSDQGLCKWRSPVL